MKYKIGDKVKIVERNIVGSAHHFKIGEIAIIDDIDEQRTYPIYCKNENNSEWMAEEEIVPFDYTWEDFLKAPIGTKVTFENGKTLVKADKVDDQFTDNNFFRSYKDLVNFKDNFNNKVLGKIVKIEEPTYTTVYEPKEEVTMPEIEEMKRLTDELCKTCDEFIKKIKEK